MMICFRPEGHDEKLKCNPNCNHVFRRKAAERFRDDVSDSSDISVGQEAKVTLGVCNLVHCGWAEKQFVTDAVFHLQMPTPPVRTAGRNGTPSMNVE